MENTGLDLHKRENQLGLLTEEGETVERRIRTSRERCSEIRHPPGLTEPGGQHNVHMHTMTGALVPRPKKRRWCHRFDGDRVFKPRSIPMTELALVRLGLDELEAMRLCDVDDHDQESAGRQMGVSRGTVQRLLVSGRAKVVRALLETSALVIEGGNDESVHTHAG